MSDKYLENYLPVIAIDVAIEEKTRIAKMAAATLHKLHNVMQQMKDWRDDSAKLKSNIWRMKMALHADDKSESDGRRIDPLITHQRAEISRLEQANDALESEVASLKRALTKTEDDVARIAVREIGDKIASIENEFSRQKEHLNDEILCLRKRLEEAEESQTSVRGQLTEFAKGDRTIETVFANAIGKIVETVVSLSEGLVNVSEDLYRFKTKNRSLRRRLDRLRAMLRLRCGSGAEYQRRIGELNDLAEQLAGEMSRLKVIRENADRDGGSDTADIPDIVRRVERLMDDLRNNLKSDREAMIAAGDPDCLRYMKKVIDLKINLKVLSVELGRSNASMHKESCENLRREKCLKATSLLDEFLKKIDIEIEKLKVKPMDKYCRIGGVSGSYYMTKVAELENIVRKSATIFTALKENPLRALNANENITDKLENLIERLCCKINDLEILDDRANLRERIDQLEAVITRLKLELMEKNERIHALNDEYASIELTLEEDRKKHEIVIADMGRENDDLREDMKKKEQEISSREREHSERRVAGMRLMKAEIDAVKKKLQGFHDDKERLLRTETERMRDILRARDKEIENIITAERDALGGALGAEVEGLRTKLVGIASDENVKLKSIIDGLEKQAEPGERRDKLKSSAEVGDGKSEGDNGDCARNLRDELERLKAESSKSKISLNEANKRIDHLERELDEAVGAKTRLRREISDLKQSNEQSLTYRLNVQTSVGEETSRRESERVMAENKALASEVEQLRNEKEQLEAELSELRTEKGLLDRSTAAANNKCAALHDQVNKFKSECNGLREKISERETTVENLKLELAKVRAELENAAVEAARLRTENSGLAGDLDALSLRNAGTEERVRVLLTEKNDLATRVNELDDESVDLRERLNKARAENEYFSMELNKSRLEIDKAKAENARLQATCDELRGERDDSRRRVNEISSECRVVSNQLEIQRMKYEALRLAAAALHRDGNDRRGHLKKMDTLAMNRERGFADAHNEIKRERDHSDAARTCIKVAEIGGGETELKVESDTCVGHDNKAKIKDRPKGELKSPGIENKALKLKQANLGYENHDVTMELARTEDGLERPVVDWNVRTSEPNDEEIVGSVRKKFEIVNIRYEKEINNYSSYSGGPQMLEDKGRSTAVGIDQPEVENRTLKTEVDILPSGLNFSLTDGEKTRLNFGEATEEIRALKFELMNLRDEKAALRSRLVMFKGELDALKFERLALKDELTASRKSNFDLRLKVNGLRSANEKLKETNAELESHLQDASRTMNECTAISEASNKSWRNNFVNTLNEIV